MNNACPTCGAVGDNPCVRGRQRYGGSELWKKQIPYPEGHPARRNKDK